MEISLRLKNLDLSNEAALEQIVEKFQDVMWSETDGLTTAGVYVEREDAVAHVMKYVREIETAFPGAKVVGVHRDLVGATDIALRTGVSREGARKWAALPDFPAPFDIIGAKDMKVWIWAEVVRWLKDERAIDMGQDLPSAELMTQIENCIMRNPDHTTVQWHQIASRQAAATKSHFESVQPAVRIFAGGRAQRIGRETYDLVGAAAPAYAH
ncbi:helix-turn-helix transcriptional regulator [Pseudarthrobacter phenanthrenivorans]|uniref:helix-turn-helix transcriptional regulator n=1 Tax=Pseudarthrobacter phenanthrenivorans TaxID=361575 RepID=UPI002F359EAE